MKQVLIVAVVAVLAMGAFAARGQIEQRNNVKAFMRKKVDHSQALLESIAVEDFPAIAKHSQQLSLLSLEAGWKVLQTEDYVQHSQEFRRAANEIHAAAEKKNLDRAALGFVDLTMKCFNCHKYVRGVRMAKGNATPQGDSKTGRAVPALGDPIARP